VCFYLHLPTRGSEEARRITLFITCDIKGRLGSSIYALCEAKTPSHTGTRDNQPFLHRLLKIPRTQEPTVPASTSPDSKNPRTNRVCDRSRNFGTALKIIFDPSSNHLKRPGDRVIACAKAPAIAGRLVAARSLHIAGSWLRNRQLNDSFTDFAIFSPMCYDFSSL
jgi:hypothetical protein